MSAPILNVFAGSGGKAINLSLLDQNFSILLGLIFANVPLPAYTTAQVTTMLADGDIGFGFAYSDSTLGYPRWWNGTIWNGFSINPGT
jgi:hypothetical protein